MNPPGALPSSGQLCTTLFIRGKYLDQGFLDRHRINLDDPLEKKNIPTIQTEVTGQIIVRAKVKKSIGS